MLLVCTVLMSLDLGHSEVCMMFGLETALVLSPDQG